MGCIAFVSVVVAVGRFDAVVLVLLALLVSYFVVWLLLLLMHLLCCGWIDVFLFLLTFVVYDAICCGLALLCVYWLDFFNLACCFVFIWDGVVAVGRFYAVVLLLLALLVSQFVVWLLLLLMHLSCCGWIDVFLFLSIFVVYDATCFGLAMLCVFWLDFFNWPVVLFLCGMYCGCFSGGCCGAV